MSDRDHAASMYSERTGTTPPLEAVTVFAARDRGYFSFRVPAMVVTTRGIEPTPGKALVPAKEPVNTSRVCAVIRAL